MLTIILGFVAAAVIFFVGIHIFDFLDSAIDACFGVILCIAVIALGFCIGLSRPVQGYSESVLKDEVALVSFSENVSSNDYGVYVISNKDGSYTVKYISNQDKESNKTYETYTFETDSENIKEYDNCKEPVLKKYVSEPVRGIWTFAIWCEDKVEYKLEVPKDSIKY